MTPTLRFSPVFLLLVSALSFHLLAQTPSKEGTATIAGIVTLNGEPMRNVVVTVQAPPTPSAQRIPPRAKTDANGRFRITGVAAGQYTIGALAAAFVTESDQAQWRYFGLYGKTIHVADDEVIENLELALKRGGVITGRITDASGEPVVETNIQLRQVNAAGQSMPQRPIMRGEMYRTDDRGVYRIFGLPAGKYKVSVGLPIRSDAFSMRTSRSYIPETFHPDTPDEAQARIIELEAGQEASDVDIRAAEALKAYEISGRVVDAETGQPVAGIGLAFGTYDPTGRLTGVMSGGWRSDANGEFQMLGARPGKHGVFIENSESKSGLYSDPATFEVINSDVEGIEVRARRGLSISGTVIIEGTNDPAVLAKRSQISLEADYYTTSAFSSSRAKVGADGKFRIVGLPAGKVRLSGFSTLPKASLLRVERNGVPLKNLELEIHPGEQINDLRVVYGYGDGIVRGQVKIVGGTLPEGVMISVSLRRTDGGYYQPLTQLDARDQFFFKDVLPGEYELRLSANFPGNRPQRELVEKIYPRLAKARQMISVSNGNEVQTTFTVDLSQENQR